MNAGKFGDSLLARSAHVVEVKEMIALSGNWV